MYFRRSFQQDMTIFAQSKSMSGLLLGEYNLLPVEFPKGICPIPYGNITFSLRE